MDVIIERCCGLDVHQATVVACLLVGSPGKKPTKEVRTFGTVMSELLKLNAWLSEQGCTHVAMESTGVYWMPVYSVLEERFTLIVGNAQHIKNVPGRKTDVKDSEWLAELCRHGLIRRSFVPPAPIRELRELLRYRRKLTESYVAESNRLMRLLETANIKISSVMSEVLGKSGRLMLRALVKNEQTPEQMASLALGKLRKKESQLAEALYGKVTDHHRFVLQMQLDRIEAVESDIVKLDKRIDEKLEPYQVQMQRLAQIPGVDRVSAATIIAELGPDMSVFATAGHAAAWAGVCPGNNESAGKKKGQTARKGNIHLTTALVQAAVCASRKKGSYFKEKFWRLKARRGGKRAAMAIAHKILVAAYYMLRDECDYKDLGGTYLDRLAPEKTKLALVKRLEQLGYKVSLSPLAPQPAEVAA